MKRLFSSGACAKKFKLSHSAHYDVQWAIQPLFFVECSIFYVAEINRQFGAVFGVVVYRQNVQIFELDELLD
jgi:hypothetical protein